MHPVVSTLMIYLRVIVSLFVVLAAAAAAAAAVAVLFLFTFVLLLWLDICGLWAGAHPFGGEIRRFGCVMGLLHYQHQEHNIIPSCNTLEGHGVWTSCTHPQIRLPFLHPYSWLHPTCPSRTPSCSHSVPAHSPGLYLNFCKPPPCCTQFHSTLACSPSSCLHAYPPRSPLS